MSAERRDEAAAAAADGKWRSTGKPRSQKTGNAKGICDTNW